MNASIVDLRYKTKQILEALDRRETVAVLYHGKVKGRLVPAASEDGIDLVRSHNDKTYSLCDAMSFMVMARLGITDAIAFDRHFAEYGRFALL